MAFRHEKDLSQNQKDDDEAESKKNSKKGTMYKNKIVRFLLLIHILSYQGPSLWSRMSIKFHPVKKFIMRKKRPGFAFCTVLIYLVVVTNRRFIAGLVS